MIQLENNNESWIYSIRRTTVSTKAYTSKRWGVLRVIFYYQRFLSENSNVQVLLRSATTPRSRKAWKL
jgi:hypothetical protein